MCLSRNTSYEKISFFFINLKLFFPSFMNFLLMEFLITFWRMMFISWNKQFGWTELSSNLYCSNTRRSCDKGRSCRPNCSDRKHGAQSWILTQSKKRNTPTLILPANTMGPTQRYLDMCPSDPVILQSNVLPWKQLFASN